MKINTTFSTSTVQDSKAQIYIGIDLGDRKHQVCVTDKCGVILKEYTIPNTKDAFLKLTSEYSCASVAIEVGTHSPWISRIFQEKGIPIFVANARKLKVISQNERKCDQRDARMLAKLLRADPGLLCVVNHNSEECQRGQLTLKLRSNLVSSRVDLVLGVRGMLKSLAVRLPDTSTPSFPTKAREILKQEDLELLDIVEPVLVALEVLNEQIKVYDRRVDELIATKYQAAIALQAIGGVGPITALSFVLIVEDPNRFKDARDVGAFLGLVPRRDQSGATDKQLPISKTGNELGRKLLVQCAQHILGPFGPDCDLRRHGLKLAERGGQATAGKNKAAQRTGGKIAKRKAVVAIARKLAVIMLTLWQKNCSYEPFRAKPEAQKAETAPQQAA
jgi:transposase